MNKIFIIISSNRQASLPQKTVSVIEKTQTPTIFIKQNLQPKYHHHPYIKEIFTKTTGSSIGRNIGIKYAIKHQANILAFTDDDCIITADWIKSIKNSFSHHSQTKVIFGQTLPYQPEKHPYEFSTCTFQKNVGSPPIKNVCRHWQDIGFSNNMAIRTEIFKKIGLFMPWIGPGAVIKNGNDAELILRILINKYPINYNHKMLIFHNKWLKKDELKKQNLGYSSGTIGAYGYYAFKGNFFCLSIVTNEFFQEFKNLFFFGNFIDQLKNILYLFKTLLITFYYSQTQ